MLWHPHRRDVSALAEACGRGPIGARVERVDVRPGREEDLAHVAASFPILQIGREHV